VTCCECFSDSNILWRRAIHGVCFAGIGSSLPPTERDTNQWGPPPPRRGRSADDNDTAVATRHAASLLEQRLGPAEVGALSAAAATRWRRRRAAELRRKRGERCRDVQPPSVTSVDAQPPDPPGPLPSHRSPPSGGGATPSATSAAVAGCRKFPAASHEPPVPAAAVLLRVGGGGGGADRGRSNGRPSAAEEAGAPVVHSVGATAGAEGGGGRRPKSRLYSPVHAAQFTTSSTEWAPATSHCVSTLCGGPRGCLCKSTQKAGLQTGRV